MKSREVKGVDGVLGLKHRTAEHARQRIHPQSVNHFNLSAPQGPCSGCQHITALPCLLSQGFRLRAAQQLDRRPSPESDLNDCCFQWAQSYVSVFATVATVAQAVGDECHFVFARALFGNIRACFHCSKMLLGGCRVHAIFHAA